jgi:hypothetical protein
MLLKGYIRDDFQQFPTHYDLSPDNRFYHLYAHKVQNNDFHN